MLVPYTLDETTFGEMPNGGRVNLEVDILAKYVQRFIESKSAGIETVTVDGHASKAVAQIQLRKSGLPMKE